MESYPYSICLWLVDFMKTLADKTSLFSSRLQSFVHEVLHLFSSTRFLIYRVKCFFQPIVEVLGCFFNKLTLKAFQSERNRCQPPTSWDLVNRPTRRHRQKLLIKQCNFIRHPRLMWKYSQRWWERLGWRTVGRASHTAEITALTLQRPPLLA